MSVRVIETRVLTVLVAAALLPPAVRAQPAPLRLAPQPALVIGSEDRGPTYQLDRVFGAVRLPDATIVVGNSATQELRFYDTQGTYLRSAGRKGAGPGEFGDYVAVRPFLLGPAAIIADDEPGARVNRYDFAGKTLPQLTLVSNPAAVQSLLTATSGETIIARVTQNSRLQGQHGQRIRTMYRYGAYDALGKQRAFLFEAPTRERIVNATPTGTHFPFLPFSSEPVVAAAPNRLYAIRQGAPEIEVWSLTGQRTGTITWPATRTKVRDIWTRWRQVELDGMTRQMDKLRYTTFWNDQLPLPEYVPVAEALFVDGAGRLWVQRTRLPWDTATVFDLLDAAGKYLGRVSMPPRFTVFQIGTDWVLGRARDENDVEQVQLYRLTK
jgi:hypothetical protein